VLHISLENRRDQTIRLYEHDLPWRSSSPFVAVAVDSANGSGLRQVRPIDDPGTKQVELGPKQRLEGMIPLNERFPNLTDLSKRKEIVVFWTYRPPLHVDRTARRAGGWLTIGKEQR